MCRARILLNAAFSDTTLTLCVPQRLSRHAYSVQARDLYDCQVGTVTCMENDTCTVYVTARGPENIDTEAVSNLVAQSDLGGVVKSHAFGPSIVTLVVDVTSLPKEAAYELVIGRMGVALGPDWTVEADVEAPLARRDFGAPTG